MTSWAKGLRVIVRKQCPHAVAQLRFTDLDRHRFTCSRLAPLASSPIWTCITAAKDTGLRNPPLHDCTENQNWLEIVALGCEFTGTDSCRYKLKRLGQRLPAVDGGLH
ncbi:hypothetical protein [Nonomuraea indica]|uniref:hypothetical protein n=1 Tax=Nonomuraea indica TaxID=1581193 RepID=UPI0011840791|nr:hypothetical protein [Nonomuraea indica]